MNCVPSIQMYHLILFDRSHVVPRKASEQKVTKKRASKSSKSKKNKRDDQEKNAHMKALDRWLDFAQLCIGPGRLDRG